VTRETHHASPLKVYEYLAAGLPVVGADVPGIRQFAGAVMIASGLPEWERAITTALSDRSPAALAARRQLVVPHTWDARVETLSEYLCAALAHQQTSGMSR